MQKAFRRAQLAKNQGERKRRLLQEKYRRRDVWRQTNEAAAARREELDAAIVARKRQREDWALGPATRPWRAQAGAIDDFAKDGRVVGTTNSRYGVFDNRRLQSTPLPKIEQIAEHKMVIRSGDRVCVIEGRPGTKGKIGKVIEINGEAGTLKVKGVNMIDVEAPSEVRTEGEDPVRSLEEPIPLESVRLVHPMKHKMAGAALDGQPTIRDTVLYELILRHAEPDEYLPEAEEKEAIAYELERRDSAFADGKPYSHFNERAGAVYRYLMPQNIRIPWPTKPEHNVQDQPADTTRSVVQEKTFLHTLLRPPMPESVIDELRHRTSRFRIRHDDDYIERKTLEDEEEEAQKKLRQSMKPKGARNIARQPQTRGARSTSERGPEGKRDTDVSPRILDILGSHIAFKKGLQKGQTASIPPPLPTAGHGPSPSP